MEFVMPKMCEIMTIRNCPLCKSLSDLFFSDKKRTYFLCNHCKALFVDQQYLPGKEEELARYNEHINDVNDIRYQHFVSPIVNEILEGFSSESSGLDFGAGTGPVISKLLSDKNFQIKLYDPFFHNYPELLRNKYDFIVCCEVIEHFHQPDKEFELLKKLLSRHGKLFCMTSIFNEKIDLKNWYYKNDLTHVIFYQTETFEYIRKHFGFSDVEIKGNLIVFSE